MINPTLINSSNDIISNDSPFKHSTDSLLDAIESLFPA